MKFSADDFRRLYAEMPDEELRSLVKEELTAVARQCYDEEVKRRGLPAAGAVRRAVRPVPRPAVVAPEPEPMQPVDPEETDQEAEEDLAAAGIFSSREEARAAKARLQSSAIPAFLEDDTHAGGGFRLLVAISYVAEAREVLGA